MSRPILDADLLDAADRVAAFLGDDAIRQRVWRALAGEECDPFAGECDRAEALDRRDDALRRIAATMPAALSARSRAALVVKRLTAYEAGAWRRDRLQFDNPYRAGDDRAALFDALRALDVVPSVERCRKILGHAA